MQPGDTITPGGSPQPAPQAPQPQPAPVQAVPTPPPAPVEATATPAPIESAPPSVEPVAEWQYAADEAQNSAGPTRPAIQPVNWTASEYVAHQKGTSWFALSGLGLVVVTIFVFLVTGKDFVAASMVALAGIIFGVFSARPPRVLNYSISETGVQIGQRLYPYHEFKSFALSEEGPLPSVLLMPLKRFLPPITVFYEPQAEDSIMNVLASYLPFEHRQPDAIDKLMSRIHF